MSFFKSDVAKGLCLILFVTVFFVISVIDLNIDVINPDGINWHTRTQAFIDALASKRYSKTFQVYHPGTTLMWVSGPLLDLFTGGSTRVSVITDPKGSFLTLDYYAKLSLIVFCTIVFLLILIVLWKMVSIKYAIFFAIPFTLEPFVVGMRRLYHLDFLMTILLFLSFLFLVYFNYKSPRWFLLIGAGFFYALAILTKSTAVIFLPAVPFIFWLGNSSIVKKLLGLLIFTLFSAVFIYAFFPPIWQNPIELAPKYYEKIAFGVMNIGVEGKKEIGTSGEGDNVILDDTVDDKRPNFYLTSLAVRFSVVGGALVLIAVSVFVYYSLKGLVLTVWESIRKKGFPKVFNYSADAWVSFWSLGLTVAALVALSIPVKKNDRYEIMVFPFLIAIVAYFLRKLKVLYAVIIVVIYIGFVSFELYSIHPYYVAYANPLLGGMTTRLYALDDAPFGIGSYAAFDIVRKDREKNGETGYYTTSGSKSIKAISAGSKFSRSPSCVTDYVIVFAMKQKEVLTCVQKYVLLDTVKVGGFDYWYVYKRLNQAHAGEK